MRYYVVFIMVLWYSNVFAQKFNKQEKEIILAGNIHSPLEIYQTNDPEQHKVLLSQSQDISPKDKVLPILVDRMKASLAATGGGVGIAGPQVGINRNVILVQRFDKKDSPVEYFINPKITWKSDLLAKGPEGDLSIEDFRDNFYRSYSIKVEYYNLDNHKKEEMVEGFTAVIFQHEIDHLFGTLISDKINTDKDLKYNDIRLFIKSKY